MEASTEGDLVSSASYEEIVEEVRGLRDQYRARAGRHRRWFRGVGLLVIVLSALLPLLTGLDFEGKDVAVGSVGVLIAASTGIRTFYQWEQLWSLLRQSDFELTYLLDRFTIAASRLRGLPPEERAEPLRELVATLRDDAETIRRAESTRYFATLQFPTDHNPQG